MSDPDLVPKARAGDRDALEQLIRRCADDLRRLVETRLGRGLKVRVRPSDVLQSAYLQVIRDIDGFDGDSEDSFRAWMNKIIENNIRMKVRFFEAAKRDAAREADLDDLTALSDVPTPASGAATVEDLLRVGRALENLSEDYRDVILSRTVDGLSHDEIATRLQRSSGAVRVLLSRARAALCLEMERLDDD